MDEILKGDRFISDTYKTEIVVVKVLGGGKFIVNGKMGDFQIREQLLRSSYRKKEKDNGTGTGTKVAEQEPPRRDDRITRRKG